MQVRVMMEHPSFDHAHDSPLSTVCCYFVLDVNQDLDLLDLHYTAEQDPLVSSMNATGMSFTSVDCDIGIYGTGLRAFTGPGCSTPTT